MNENHEQQLQSFGYRKFLPGKWAKPIGYGIAIIDKYKIEIFFYGQKDKLLLWHSSELDFTENHKPLLHQVSEGECEGFQGCSIRSSSTRKPLTFIAIQEQITSHL